MKSIIFTHNIPAIIAGDKTQTRRTAGLEAVNQNPDEWKFNTFVYRQKTLNGKTEMCAQFRNKRTFFHEYIKPRYKAGDLVYVKEATWECIDNNDKVRYVADGPTPTTDRRHYKKKSPLYLKQIHSRITLRILEVKAPERVKSISREDAIAEGITEYISDFDSKQHTEQEIDEWRNRTSQENFLALWDSINAKRGMGTDKNPWCFPYVFEVVK